MLVGVVGCLLLAGCTADGSGDEPETLPPIEPSPSTPAATSASQSPPPATDPTPTTSATLVDEHSPTVDAIVTEFFTTLNAAKDTGDFAAYDALYLPQCEGCLDLRAEVEEWLAGGQPVQGGDWVILQQNSTQFPDGSRGSANAFVYRTEAVAESGEVLGEPGNSPIQLFQLGVLGAGDPWLIERVGWLELDV